MKPDTISWGCFSAQFSACAGGGGPRDGNSGGRYPLDCRRSGPTLQPARQPAGGVRARFIAARGRNGSNRARSGSKNPARCAGSTALPSTKLFLSDGQNAWLYLPADRQVRKTSARKLDDLRSPLGFPPGKGPSGEGIAGPCSGFGPYAFNSRGRSPSGCAQGIGKPCKSSHAGGYTGQPDCPHHSCRHRRDPRPNTASATRKKM